MKIYYLKMRLLEERFKDIGIMTVGGPYGSREVVEKVMKTIRLRNKHESQPFAEHFITEEEVQE